MTMNGNQERGSALISVVLVVFVLTMVGIAGVLYMTMEDKLSSNEKLQQAGLYAAEAGLRAAEQQVKAIATDSTSINGLLALTTSPPPLTAPGGGYNAVTLGTSFYDQAITLPTGAPGETTWSAYVRNNIDDIAGSDATHDQDQKINIVVVGTVSAPSGRTVTKVLEEQMFVGGAGGGERLMKGGNIGGTGAAGIGGT